LKNKTIFIFAYYSYNDPVFQSAVLPYFTDLKINHFNLVLLTWEQKRFKQSKSEKTKTHNFLKSQNIIWYNTTWHSGRFKLLKKGFDVSWGIILSLYIILKHKVNIIYSEGFPGAIIGHLLSLITRKKHVVHTFEPHADAMIEAGVWRSNSWEAKILKYYEKRIATKASLIITATQKMIEVITAWGTNSQFLRAPSCVDIEKFTFSERSRLSLREHYKIKDDECIIIYLGKLGGMYMEEEIFEFFSYCQQNSVRKFKFWILSIEPAEKIKSLFKAHNIRSEKYLINSVKRDDVYKYLSAADIGFVAVRPKPSRRFCSPIKDGEYWACGLPIIIPKGISDDFHYAEKYNIGAVIGQPNIEGYKAVLNWIEKNYRNFSLIRTQAREFVLKDRSVTVYKNKIIDKLNSLLE